MFRQQAARKGIGSATTLLELIYHSIVRNIRKSHGNALYGLLMNIAQTLILVAAFYVLFSLLGMRASSIRGDFLLYIMSGIFLYMTSTKAMGAVVGSEGPASPMMQHAPMTTAIAITSAALASLYIQVLSAFVVLAGYHMIVTPLVIEDPVGTVGMLLLSWFSGVSIGMVLLAAKPWAPDMIGLVATIYGRANMIASGKMFVANTLPAYMLVYFCWNPLFHCIDQARGFVFVNYNPHHSSIAYPFYLSLALLMIGLMGEFFTRKHASASWAARR